MMRTVLPGVPITGDYTQSTSLYNRAYTLGVYTLYWRQHKACRTLWGGSLVAFFSGARAGFPGCNSYDFKGAFETNTQRSFEPDGKHLGDVLGIIGAGGPGRTEEIRWPGFSVDMSPVNEMIIEEQWMDFPVCATGVVLSEEAEVLAVFDDGSPAAWRHPYGAGMVYGYAYDLPAIANNMTIPALYGQWDGLMERLGCRKVLDTGDYYVEAGVWRDREGRRTVFLVNHDAERPRSVALPDGVVVRLLPGESVSRVIGP